MECCHPLEMCTHFPPSFLSHLRCFQSLLFSPFSLFYYWPSMKKVELTVAVSLIVIKYQKPIWPRNKLTWKMGVWGIVCVCVCVCVLRWMEEDCLGFCFLKNTQRFFLLFHILTIRMFSSSIVFFFFWLFHVSCGISIAQPGIQPLSPPLEAWSLTHWTAREGPVFLYFHIIN